MKIVTYRKIKSLVFSLITLLAFHLSVIRANQPNPPAIIGLSDNPAYPHYATIRENGLLEITNYQTSTVIGEYLIPLPFQDITNLDPTGLNIKDIVYSPNGDFIAVSTGDISSRGMVYILNWQTGLVKQAYDQINLNRIEDMSWSPDSSRLVVASLDGGADQTLYSTIAVVNPISGELDQTLADMGRIDAQSLSVVAWSSENLISYGKLDTIIFFDANTSTNISTANISTELLDAAWSPDGRHLATLHEDRTLQIWDINVSLSAPVQTLSIVAENFLSKDMQWLDNTLVAVNIWSDIQIWNTATGVLEDVIETDNFVFGIGVLPDNQLIFAGPQAVITYSLTDLRTPTPPPMKTSTPAPTFTPTPTVTSTPTPSTPLRLTSLCSPDPASVRVWRVRNPNITEQTITWNVVGTQQTGTVTVPAASGSVQGEAFFQTVTVSGANTTRITLNGVQQDVKASGTTQCAPFV